MRFLRTIAWLFVLLAPACCFAHVGSPDVFFQGSAGPYHLVVMVRTPQMIPGIAEIQIHSDTAGIREMKATPLYIVGAGAKYPPAPDALEVSSGDAQSFTGKLWLMDAGSWQVKLDATGSLGSGTLSVPVAAYARSTLPMQKSLGALLLVMLILLVTALVSIFGAARREGALRPGEKPNLAQRRGARWVMAGGFVLVVFALAIGNRWWDTAAANNVNRKIYQPPNLAVSLSGSAMTLRVGDSAWHDRRPDTVMTEIIPDHGHLMHLFLISAQMDHMYHLHPDQNRTDPSTFVENLPPVAPGHYKIFADIVRASGFPDTMISEVDIPQMNENPLSGDDSVGSAAPLRAQSTGNLSAPLSDGAKMVWERAPGTLPSNQLLWFKFRVDDANGKPVSDLEPYMGMAGHAEFVVSDFSVFAHVHPDGSASMAAIDLAAGSSPGSGSSKQSNAMTAMPGMDMSGMAGMSMPGMDMSGAAPLPPEVWFPYGFPKPGLYRIFVQVKRKGKVETGVFDAAVN
jgi:hypothetical protein